MVDPFIASQAVNYPSGTDAVETSTGVKRDNKKVWREREKLKPWREIWDRLGH